MCGIVACIGPNSDNGLAQSLGSIYHRGPDSEGIANGKNWIMGIRRLSIIDVKSGDQPLCNEDKSIWMVCNGEIYNHASLRTRLKSLGHSFRTGSDVEVIVHLYEEYGDKFVEHLQGMFTLFLSTPDGFFIARDRLGIKPLYEMQVGENYYYASEIRALLAIPEAPAPKTDAQRIADYFIFRYVPEPNTAFVDIHKFPSAQLTKIKSGVKTNRIYWNLEKTNVFKGNFEDAVVECEERIRNVTEMHMMSERPIGVFLSGGLDSSVLASLAVESNGKNTILLTSSFPGDAQDETSYAKIVAKQLGVNHITYDMQEFKLEDWDRSIDVMEDLVADPAAIPLIILSKIAREHMVVALFGEGSDEVNLGYYSYLWLSKRLRRRKIFRSAGIKLKAGRLADIMGYPALDENEFFVKSLYNRSLTNSFPDFLQPLPNPVERIHNEVQMRVNCEHESIENINRLFAIRGWMKDDLLAKVDKTSMSAGIEARVPFLDHTFVDWTFNLPTEYLLRGASTKAVLRSFAQKILPEQISRRNQHGFIVPMRKFIASAFEKDIKKTLLSQDALWRFVFSESDVLSRLDRYSNGDDSLFTFVYRLINLELWGEKWLKN